MQNARWESSCIPYRVNSCMWESFPITHQYNTIRILLILVVVRLIELKVGELCGVAEVATASSSQCCPLTKISGELANYMS